MAADELAKEIVKIARAARSRITDMPRGESWRGVALVALADIMKLAERASWHDDEPVIRDGTGKAVAIRPSRSHWPDGRYQARLGELGNANFSIENGRVRHPDSVITQFNGRTIEWFNGWVQRHDGSIIPTFIPPACRNER